MARGINNINSVLLPIGSGGRGCDSDTPFFLLGHPVHRGVTIIHPTGTVYPSGRE